MSLPSDSLPSPRLFPTRHSSHVALRWKLLMGSRCGTAYRQPMQSGVGSVPQGCFRTRYWHSELLPYAGPFAANRHMLQNVLIAFIHPIAIGCGKLWCWIPNCHQHVGEHLPSSFWNTPKKLLEMFPLKPQFLVLKAFGGSHANVYCLTNSLTSGLIHVCLRLLKIIGMCFVVNTQIRIVDGISNVSNIYCQIINGVGLRNILFTSFENSCPVCGSISHCKPNLICITHMWMWHFIGQRKSVKFPEHPLCRYGRFIKKESDSQVFEAP